ncbi:MAG TPA: hypothetical protein VN205_08590, partial [Thermomonas sp.]|nr:hypothetical protein [Thermomonas sp.]
MHKLTLSLLAVLLANACVAGSACAQAPAPPRSTGAPARIAMPDAALRSAFEDAARGTLASPGLATHASHPLAGWLEYAILRRDFATLPTDRGGIFLGEHRGQPVAVLFRNEWLAALARRKEWAAFLSAWDNQIDDPGLRCAHAQARLELGRVDGHWTREVQALWRG